MEPTEGTCALCHSCSVAAICSPRCEELFARQRSWIAPLATEPLLPQLLDDNNGLVPLEYLLDALAVNRRWYLSSLAPPAEDVVGLFAAAPLAPGEEINLACPPLVRLGLPVTLHPAEWLAYLDSTTPSDSLALHKRLQTRWVTKQNDASRFSAHSCSPTLFCDSAAGPLSTRGVSVGEALSLSRLSSVELYLSTSVRRDLLALQHGIGYCRCRRCASATDGSRQVQCACGGVKTLCSELHGASWACSVCGDSWTQTEMVALHREEHLSKTVFELWGLFERVSSGRQQLEKHMFQSLKDSATSADVNLGRGHWVSLLVAKCAINYFTAIRSRSREASGAAETLIVGWIQNFVLCAQQQNLFSALPWHISGDLEACSAILSSTHSLVHKRLALLLANVRHHKDHHASLTAVVRDTPTPQELFQTWENFLLARVGENGAARDYVLNNM